MMTTIIIQVLTTNIMDIDITTRSTMMKTRGVLTITRIRGIAIDMMADVAIIVIEDSMIMVAIGRTITVADLCTGAFGFPLFVLMVERGKKTNSNLLICMRRFLICGWEYLEKGLQKILAKYP